MRNYTTQMDAKKKKYYYSRNGKGCKEKNE